MNGGTHDPSNHCNVFIARYVEHRRHIKQSTLRRHLTRRQQGHVHACPLLSQVFFYHVNKFLRPFCDVPLRQNDPSSFTISLIDQSPQFLPNSLKIYTAWGSD